MTTFGVGAKVLRVTEKPERTSDDEFEEVKPYALEVNRLSKEFLRVTQELINGYEFSSGPVDLTRMHEAGKIVNSLPNCYKDILPKEGRNALFEFYFDNYDVTIEFNKHAKE